MNCKRMCVVAMALAAWLSAAPAAQAQPSVMDYRWSFDVGLGWDNSISGNINSGAIGTSTARSPVVRPQFLREGLRHRVPPALRRRVSG